MTERHVMRATLLGLLFVLSGATSLVYQVVWVRTLSLFFGSDVYAAAIMLSVFMAGLGLGSWAAAQLSDRIAKPLFAYALCEVLIGVSALIFPVILAAFEGTYQSIYRSSFETAPLAYHGFRVLVATATLLVPTALMGATLPLIIRYVVTAADTLGTYVGRFYAVNTLGALLGAVVTGFYLLPAFGVARTVAGAATVNISIALIAALLSRMSPPQQTSPPQGRRASAHDRRILVVMMLSGLAALALEVVWMRILVQSFSATVYAFTIMLASFLFGIFAGSHLASRTVDRDATPGQSLASLEFWIGGAVAVLTLAMYLVPLLFSQLLWRLATITSGSFGIASTVAQGATALVLIAIPTLLLGATFPFAVKAYARDIDERGRATGTVYAANTVGGVAGALTGALILLPVFGAHGSMVVIAALFVGAGAVLAGKAALGSAAFRTAAAIAFAGALLLTVAPMRTAVNFNLQNLDDVAVLYHGEGVSQTVDILRSRHGDTTTMMVNGNIEADTTFTQRRHFILKAHLPLLLHPQPRRVAVVGLGLGITLSAATRVPWVDTIRVIELAPEMVAAHRSLPELTGGVLDHPKLQLRVDDGRNFMAMSDETFDVITADPIHPRITGVGYLYTRQYYEQLRERLRPGGIVVQWMPMYHISRPSFDVALRTFAEVYPHATFWYVRGHGLLVGGDTPLTIDYGELVRRFNDPHVRQDFASIEMAEPEDFLSTLLMDAAQTRRYLAASPVTAINTDDNAYLEYRTPFEYLDRTEAIVAALVPFAGWDVDRILVGAPEAFRARLRSAIATRRTRLEPELRESLR